MTTETAGPAEPKGVCLLRTPDSGQPYAVRTQHGIGTIDLNIDYYEQKGYRPKWQSLKDCPGTGSNK